MILKLSSLDTIWDKLFSTKEYALKLEVSTNSFLVSVTVAAIIKVTSIPMIATIIITAIKQNPFLCYLLSRIENRIPFE